MCNGIARVLMTLVFATGAMYVSSQSCAAQETTTQPIEIRLPKLRRPAFEVQGSPPPTKTARGALDSLLYKPLSVPAPDASDQHAGNASFDGEENFEDASIRAERASQTNGVHDSLAQVVGAQQALGAQPADARGPVRITNKFFENGPNKDGADNNVMPEPDTTAAQTYPTTSMPDLRALADFSSPNASSIGEVTTENAHVQQAIYDTNINPAPNSVRTVADFSPQPQPTSSSRERNLAINEYLTRARSQPMLRTGATVALTLDDVVSAAISQNPSNPAESARFATETYWQLFAGRCNALTAFEQVSLARELVGKIQSSQNEQETQSALTMAAGVLDTAESSVSRAMQETTNAHDTLERILGSGLAANRPELVPFVEPARNELPSVVVDEVIQAISASTETSERVAHVKQALTGFENNATLINEFESNIVEWTRAAYPQENSSAAESPVIENGRSIEVERSLNAISQLAETRRAYVESLINQQRAVVEMRAVTGTLFPSDARDQPNYNLKVESVRTPVNVADYSQPGVPQQNVPGPGINVLDRDLKEAVLSALPAPSVPATPQVISEPRTETRATDNPFERWDGR